MQLLSFSLDIDLVRAEWINSALESITLFLYYGKEALSSWRVLDRFEFEHIEFRLVLSSSFSWESVWTIVLVGAAYPDGRDELGYHLNL